MLCIFSVNPSGETVNVTVVDSIDSTVVASTTVSLGADITSWLNSLAIPTHDGYVFSDWEITAGYITNVTDNATVYIKYVQDSGGGTQEIKTYVNGDGDICVQISNLQDEISGEAAVTLSFSKSLRDLFSTLDVYEFGAGAGSKVDAEYTNSNNLRFTDEDCSTHDYYRVGFYDESGNRLGQSLWDDGLYIRTIKFNFSDNTEKTYTVTKM